LPGLFFFIALALAPSLDGQEHSQAAPDLVLNCLQYDPTQASVGLDWTADADLTEVVISRDGKVIARFGGTERSLNDLEIGFGIHRYTLQGRSGDGTEVAVSCSISLRPAPVAKVFCTQLDPAIPHVIITWRNGMEYDEIRLYHGKELEQILPGQTDQALRENLPTGRFQVAISGVVDGVESKRASCPGKLFSGSDLKFTLKTKDTEATYDPSTGVGEVRVSVTAVEDQKNPGYPNRIQGFQLATGYDPSLLDPVNIEPGSGLSSPDFFDGQLLPDGVTVGAIMSFRGEVTLDLSSEKEIAVTTFETNIDSLGETAAKWVSELEFKNGLGTGAPVDTLLVLDGQSIRPTLIPGRLILRPEGMVPFRRGDLDGDDHQNIADIGVLVAILVAYDEMAPLDDCLDAADTDDNGVIDLADLYTLVGSIFSAGADLASPHLNCDYDANPDQFPCSNYRGACN